MDLVFFLLERELRTNLKKEGKQSDSMRSTEDHQLMLEIINYAQQPTEDDTGGLFPLRLRVCCAATHVTTNLMRNARTNSE